MATWVVTCSCGWTSDFSQRWHAESVAKLHPRLGEASIAHTVTIEGPPRPAWPEDEGPPLLKAASRGSTPGRGAAIYWPETPTPARRQWEFGDGFDSLALL
jgi:hypothetical protein